MSKKDSYEAKAWDLIRPEAEALGMTLVDVEYLKEGGENILRTYIDKEGGVSIDDCETLSRIIDPILDREAFIQEAYTMEVSSPGLGRPLKRVHDFEFAMGKEIEIRTYKAIEKQKEFKGILKDFSETEVTVETEDGTRKIQRAEISVIRLAYDF